jgi:hypothetical protein
VARETDMTGREPVPGELPLAREDLTAGLDGYRRLGIDDLIIGLRPVTVRSIDCLGHGQSGPRHSLISRLIHLRTPASIGVYHRPLSSQRDLRTPNLLTRLLTTDLDERG